MIKVCNFCVYGRWALILCLFVIWWITHQSHKQRLYLSWYFQNYVSLLRRTGWVCILCSFSLLYLLFLIYLHADLFFFFTFYSTFRTVIWSPPDLSDTNREVFTSPFYRWENRGSFYICAYSHSKRTNNLECSSFSGNYNFCSSEPSSVEILLQGQESHYHLLLTTDLKLCWGSRAGSQREFVRLSIQCPLSPLWGKFLLSHCGYFW